MTIIAFALIIANSNNFEQNNKAPHYASPSYVVFLSNLLVAHISVALIFYLYYTGIFYFVKCYTAIFLTSSIDFSVL